MEVRVEAVGAEHAPPDTFVSLRIGEVQKQSRFADSRTYKFPDPGAGREGYGRIEVFKRIGHVTVKFDDLGGMAQDVVVPCDFPGVKKLTMKLAVQGAAKNEFPEAKGKLGPKGKSKKEQAQKYLEEHKLEELLADAMRELIHNKPRDPHAFLSEHILKHGAQANTSLPPAAKPRSRQGTREKLSPLSPEDFAAYYKASFKVLQPSQLSGLYAKFSAPHKTVIFPTMSTPPVLQGPAFKKLPSVATWFMKPYAPQKALGATTPEIVLDVVPQRPFSLKPSVATWLMVQGPKVQLPASSSSSSSPPAPVVPFQFKPSVASWLAKKPILLPGSEKPPTPPPPPTPWGLRPSVGTWLARKPFELPPPKLFHELPQSSIKAMSKDELVHSVFVELEEKDRQIHELQALLQQLKQQAVAGPR